MGQEQVMYRVVFLKTTSFTDIQGKAITIPRDTVFHQVELLEALYAYPPRYELGLILNGERKLLIVQQAAVGLSREAPPTA